MPATSLKQKKFMDAAAHNPSFAKKAGIPTKVAKEYSEASKGQTFKRGGDMATKKMNPFAKFEKTGKDVEIKGKGKEGSKKEEAFDRTQMMGMKRGGATKKMAAGGLSSGHKSADGIARKGKTQGSQVKMNRGGKC